MTTINGVIHGKTIELEREPGLPEGQRIAVELRLLDEPPAWLDRFDTASVLIIKALDAYAVCSSNKSNVWLAPAVTRVLPLPVTGRSEP
jgi:hypothetical protein